MQAITMKKVATRWLSKQEFVLIASICDKIRGVNAQIECNLVQKVWTLLPPGGKKCLP